MTILYVIIGIIIGLVIAVLNVLIYRKEVQLKAKKFFTKKAIIINPKTEVEEIDLT